MQFDYYYGTQAEQFTFCRIPKLLITSPVFKKLSDSAKPFLKTRIVYPRKRDRQRNFKVKQIRS